MANFGMREGDLVNYLHLDQKSGKTMEIPIVIDAFETETHILCHTVSGNVPPICGCDIDKCIPITITPGFLKQNRFSNFRSDPKSFYFTEGKEFDLQYTFCDRCNVFDYERRATNGAERVRLLTVIFVHHMQHILRDILQEDVANSFTYITDWKDD